MEEDGNALNIKHEEDDGIIQVYEDSKLVYETSKLVAIHVQSNEQNLSDSSEYSEDETSNEELIHSRLSEESRSSTATNDTGMTVNQYSKPTFEFGNKIKSDILDENDPLNNNSNVTTIHYTEEITPEGSKTNVIVDHNSHDSLEDVEILELNSSNQNVDEFSNDVTENQSPSDTFPDSNKVVHCSRTNQNYALNIQESKIKPHGKATKQKKNKISPKCEVCLKIFSHKGALKRHMRIHSGEKAECEICGHLFSQVSSLTRHMKVHAGTIEKNHHCPICSKAFANKFYCQAHMRVHTGERPFKCEVCEKPFATKSDINAHMRIHTGEKPYKCGVCGKEFSHNGNLSVHMRRHTGEKPYVCDICNQSFITCKDIKSHMKRHTGEKPHQCEVCHKWFSQMSSVTRHMRIHTGERPYKCNVCEKSFTSTFSLKIHQRRHTGEKPYECEFCQKSFVCSSDFKTHLRTHKVEVPSS